MGARTPTGKKTMCASPDTRWYTVNEIADRLKVSVRSVRRWIADGRLREHKFGRAVRIAEQDLIAFEKASQR